MAVAIGRTRHVAAFLGAAAAVACSEPSQAGRAGDASVIAVDSSGAASPGAWRINARGFGPLSAGMSASAAELATQRALRLPDGATAMDCTYASWDAAPSGMAVMFEEGTLARIEVREPGIATEEGVEVGSPLTRVDSAYGRVAERRPHKYEEGEYVIVQPFAPADTIHRLVLEITGGKVRRMFVGRYPPVEYVEGCA